MFERKHFSQGLHCVNKSVIFSRNFLLYTVYTSIYFLKNLISLGFLLKKSLCAGKNQLEKLQAQCLRKILGVHKNSSANAVEVIAGVMPIRHCLRELCMREYCKIMARDEKDCLRQMIESASNFHSSKG